MTQRESFERLREWYQNRFGNDYGLLNDWVEENKAALKADIVGKLEAVRPTGQEYDPYEEGIDDGIDKAIEIVKKAGE